MIYYFDGEDFVETTGINASDSQKTYIEKLLCNASLDEDQKDRIYREYLDYKDFEAAMTIDYLLNNQLHPVFDNARPNQTDIINTIKNQIK